MSWLCAKPCVLAQGLVLPQPIGRLSALWRGLCPRVSCSPPSRLLGSCPHALSRYGDNDTGSSGGGGGSSGGGGSNSGGSSRGGRAGGRGRGRSSSQPSLGTSRPSSPPWRGRQDGADGPTSTWGRGRGGGRSASWSPPRPPGVPPDIPDLPSLAALVEREAGSWAARGDVRTLGAAFNKLVKLGSGKRLNADLTLRTMRTLAPAYLPLVPGLRDTRWLTATLWACGKLGFWEGGLAEALLQRLAALDAEGRPVLRGANGHDHANLWWSVSEAPQQIIAMAGPSLRLSADCLARMPAEQLGPQACSNVLLACARLQRYDRVLVHHLTACLASCNDADEQQKANTLYSLGELAKDCGHQPRPEDLQRLAEQVEERLRQGGGSTAKEGFISLGLSNMLLGCAKLGYNEPALLRPLAAAVGRAARRMTEQALANSLYALGKLGCSDAEYANAVQQLYCEMRQRLERTPSALVPQDLANMLWVLPALRPGGWKQHAEALAAECRRREFSGFKPQDISNNVWALAKLGWTDKDQGWYGAAMAAALQPGVMDEATAQEWSNLWYGLALVRHRPPQQLLAAMVEGGRTGQGALATLRTSAKAQEAANLLWSLAVLGLPSCEDGEGRVDAHVEVLVGVLTDRLGELLRQDPAQMKEQEVANSLWALAVMGPELLSRHSSLVEDLLVEAAQRWERFLSVELAQLWQVQQELERTGGGGVVGLGRLLEAGGPGSEQGAWLDASRSAAELESQQPDPGTISQLQRQVFDTAQRLKDRSSEANPRGGSAVISLHSECPVEGRCGRIDVVVELEGGRRVAVEVDGPGHFLANPPHTRTKDGATRLRDRQLRRLFGVGNVVSVPYWEWGELRGEGKSERQEEYLCRLLGLQAHAAAGGRQVASSQSSLIATSFNRVHEVALMPNV